MSNFESVSMAGAWGHLLWHPKNALNGAQAMSRDLKLLVITGTLFVVGVGGAVLYRNHTDGTWDPGLLVQNQLGHMTGHPPVGSGTDESPLLAAAGSAGSAEENDELAVHGEDESPADALGAGLLTSPILDQRSPEALGDGDLRSTMYGVRRPAHSAAEPVIENRLADPGRVSETIISQKPKAKSQKPKAKSLQPMEQSSFEAPPSPPHNPEYDAEVRPASAEEFERTDFEKLDFPPLPPTFGTRELPKYTSQGKVIAAPYENPPPIALPDTPAASSPATDWPAKPWSPFETAAPNKNIPGDDTGRRNVSNPRFRLESDSFSTGTLAHDEEVDLLSPTSQPVIGGPRTIPTPPSKEIRTPAKLPKAPNVIARSVPVTRNAEGELLPFARSLGVSPRQTSADRATNRPIAVGKPVIHSRPGWVAIGRQLSTRSQEESITDSRNQVPSQFDVVEPTPVVFEPIREQVSDADQGVKFIPVGTIRLPADMRPVKVEAYNIESYIVLAGDTYSTIAEQMRGSGQYAPALIAYNRAKVEHNERLRPNTRIYVPPKDILERELKRLDKKFSASATNPIPPRSTAFEANPITSSLQPPASSLQLGPTYTVQQEETLYGVAARTLGDGKRWKEVYQLNKDRLQNDQIIPVGITLRLPRDAKIR